MVNTVSTAPIRLQLLLAPLALILSIGCGGPDQSLTGPSTVPGATSLLATSTDGAAAADAARFEALGHGRGGSGNGTGNGRGHGRDEGRGDDSTRGPGRGGDDDRGPGRGDDEDEDENEDDEDNRGPGNRDDGRVVGFVSAVGADTMTVNGMIVAVAPDTRIRHGQRILTLADIAVGDHVHARGTMEEGVLVATEIKVQDTGHDNGGTHDVEIEGAIRGLSTTAGCPIVTFTIGATTVRTSAATIFDGVMCATLADGAFVSVDGLRQPDRSILATKVDAAAGPDVQ